MNRFGDDASSAESEHSDESQPKQSLVNVKLPSMYSPESKASVAASPGSKSSRDDGSNRDGASNADDGDIDVEIKGLSNDLNEIFGLVDSYEPVEIEHEAPLKPFMPSYVPAIGEVDPMVKIPRPDGVPDGLGTAILDEPIPSLQSNPAVVELQLRNHVKRGSGRAAAVHSLANPKESSEEINQWIQSVENVHASKPPSEVRYQKNKLPRTQDLMRPWPKEMEDQLRSGEVEFPSPDIDLSVIEYARVVCSLLGIPVHEGRAIESVHVLFSLFLEAQGSAETDVF